MEITLKTRIVAMILALILIFSILPLSVFAQSAEGDSTETNVSASTKNPNVIDDEDIIDFPVTFRDVTTSQELEEALNDGIDAICITASFFIDRTYYVTSDTIIYGKGDVTLTRNPDFAGDIFVVGQESNADLCANPVSFSIGAYETEEGGSLTVNGNSENMTVSVLGSVIFVCTKSTADLYSGLTVTNCKKVGNDRANDSKHSLTNTTNIGGAVGILAKDSFMNIYGGTYSNNHVNTTGECIYGGAFYNYATLTVYGGLFENNSANRAGAFYNYRTLSIYNADIRNNSASTAGGAIYLPSSSAAKLYLGGNTELANSSVTFVGNSAGTNGGAIHTTGRVTAVDTVFESNSADNGGAISVTGSNSAINISSCEFKSNSSTENGGAIYSTGHNSLEIENDVTVTNCVFDENYAPNGGAITLTSGAFGLITNSVFGNNSAKSYGGALRIVGSYATLDNLELYSNSSASAGCISFDEGATIVANKLNAYNNSATSYGAVLYGSESTITVYNSSFRSNTAKAGSAVYLSTNTVSSIYGTNFTSNTCLESNASNAGALFVYTGEVETILHSCTFTQNTSSGLGGAILVSGKSNLTLYNTTAIENSAVKGGFLYETASGTIVTISGLTVSNNSATSGGPIIWGNTANAKLFINKSNHTDLDISGEIPSDYWSSAIANKLTVKESTIEIPDYVDYSGVLVSGLWSAVVVTTPEELRKALDEKQPLIKLAFDMEFSGTIYVNYSTTIFSTSYCTIKRAKDFNGNLFVVTTDGSDEENVTLTLGLSTTSAQSLFVIEGGEVGYAISVSEGANLNIYDGVTISNSSFALSIDEGATVNIYGGLFTSNTNVNDEITGIGAILNNGTLNILGGTFSDNEADLGGIIYNVGTLTISGGSFENNVATNGGAIYNRGTMETTDGNFTSNSAINGGAIYSDGDYQTISSRFDNNTATNGGAIYVSSYENLSFITSGEFVSNKATNGGAIYVDNNDCHTDNASFTSNSATNGGAIYVLGGIASINNSSFNSNTATNGGAVYFTLSEATVVNTNARYNYAKENGGFVYADNSKLSASTNSFSCNDAVFGGTIYAKESNVTVSSGEFGSNSAVEGGAIYVESSSLHLDSPTFNANSSDYNGGALAVINSSAYLKNVIFNNNTSANDGGAIYSLNSTLTAYDSSFISNTSNMNGGAISLDESTKAKIYTSSFTGNASKRDGGAVYAASNTTEALIQLSQFTSNKALGFGGAIYACDKVNVNLYNNIATKNNAVRGGFAYINNAETILTIIDLTVSENTASSGPIVYGNSNGAFVYLNKSLYSDTAVENLTDAYYRSAFYGQLTLKAITDDAPEFIEEGNEPSGNLTSYTEVSNAKELEDALNAKKSVIKIVADFEIDRTFYITYDVTIFSTAYHVLTRASDFGGDIFVVGEYADGTNSVIESADDKLTLGNPTSQTSGLLVIDGNKSNMTVDVYGSVFFVCSGATVNLYENVSVINCHKTQNEKTYEEKYLFSRPNRIGGSVAIIAHGVVNVYGGVYANNSVALEDSSTEETRNSTLGGVFYNKSNLNIYGGLFESNEGARGGIVYSYAMTKIVGGSFISNHATVSGGVYYSPSYSSCHLNIGYSSTSTILFKNNTSQSNGGVICTSTLNGFVIHGNTIFEGNKSINGSGGVIYTSSMVTVKDTQFINNSAKSYGGAIYASRASQKYDSRFVRLENCTFIGNNANSGGAIALYPSSDSYDTGAVVNIYNSQFTLNNAKYGGAVYSTRSSVLRAYNSSFNENNADEEGGAFYFIASCVTTIDDCEISGNTANNGGAISIRSATLNVNSTRIENNTSSKNGGAFYIAYSSNIDTNSKVTLTYSTIKDNKSNSNGGAIYATRRDITDYKILTVKYSDFAQNTAKLGGGAILLTAGAYATMNDVTFVSNKTTSTSEGTGGAISLLNSSTLEINNGVFTKNYSADYGGALYVASSSSAILNNVTASRNQARAHGGFLYGTFGDATIYNSSFNANTASMGGAIYLYEGATSKIYTSEFKNNSSSENGGALFLYTFGQEVVVNGCTFAGNNADGCGGGAYISGETVAKLYNNKMTNNQAANGGAMYITKASTAVRAVGLTVSGNTASSGGNIIWGNTKNATLYIDVNKYTDLDFSGAKDDAYWSEAIANSLKVERITEAIPSPAKYNSVLEAVKTNPKKTAVSVNDVFDLALNSSDGFINSTYDKFPVLDNSSNFMSKGTTVFDNINGETVTVDTFVYENYAVEGNMTVGEALMIYQAMLYKQENPTEDVYIDISAYRFSVQTAININRDSRYFGYARCLPHANYDEFGFVRVSYLLVSAAKMGIHVNIIGHAEGYPIVYSSLVPTKFVEYFSSFVDEPCDPNYVTDAVIGDYLDYSFSAWTIGSGGKGGTDMMHTKLCAVSHYIDMNGEVHKNAVWTSSSNLDGIKDAGYNANWKLQTATIVSDHEQIYNTSVNYLRLMRQYTDDQEGIIEFQHINNVETTKQIDLILAGRGNEIAKEDQLVYIGTENDDVFELYFAPFAGDILSWDEIHNPYCKYLRELYNSEDYILFTWNAAEYSGNFPLGQQIEQMIIDAFHNNKNPNNQIYANMESFDETTFDDLIVGEDIGFKSINKWELGSVHNKDLQFSYVKDGQRYYVSLLNSLNLHGGSMYYQSNSALVIKETTCSENSVFAIVAKYSTTADLITHNFTEEQVQPATSTEHGYKYQECLECGHIEILETIHYGGEWIVEKVATPNENGIRYKTCLVCDMLTESEETKYSGQVISPDSSSGMEFTSSTIIPITVNKTPLTFEATIQLDKKVNNRGGVIIGNYSSVSDENAISLEIFSGGRVRLFFINKGIRTDILFSTDIRSSESVHIAVTVDGKNASLYVNGVLTETIVCTNTLPTELSTFNIGGDTRTIDPQIFKGKIYSACLFGDVRTSEEINNDMTFVSTGTDNVLCAKYLDGSGDVSIDYVAGQTSSGATFTPSTLTPMGTLDEAPKTFEAVIMLPTSYNDRAGVIIGNYYDSYTNAISIEVAAGGKLRLFFLENNLRGDYTFSYDIRSNEPTHIALTVDNKIAKLYVNGEFVEEITLNRTMPSLTEGFYIGNDTRAKNEQYFKGTIYSVSLFSSVRTAEEIKNDAILVGNNEEGLIKSLIYTNEGFVEYKGQAFDTNTIGSTACTFDSTPMTFEAIIQLSKDYTDRGGVIVSNNFMYSDLISFEIYKNGKLRLYYRSGTTVSDVRFDTDVRSDSPVHLALSIDNTTAYVYLNGELVEIKALPQPFPVSCEGFHIGGDLRPDRSQYFKGTIYSVSLFDHARSQEEIKNDIYSLENVNGLLFTTQYAAPKYIDKTKTHGNTEFIIVNEALNGSDGFGKIVCLTCNETVAYASIPYMADGIINNNYTNASSALKDKKYYKIEEIFKNSPKTFEFLLQISPSIADRGGVILGNYDNASEKLNLEVYNNGCPRVWFKVNNVSYSYVFDVDIRSDEVVHVAFTFDGLNASLYVNGEYKETITMDREIPYDYTSFYVANDKRVSAQPFKGQIFSASIFSDIRTPEEIKHDTIMITSDADNLLFYKYFVASEVVEAKGPWSDKTAIFIGDSITYGTNCEGSTYWELLMESLELRSVEGLGVPGSCISSTSDYGTSNDPLINRYETVGEADLIVIFMGTNDYGHDTPLGTIDDTSDTSFYGALNVIISGLKAKHPNATIVFATPIHRYGFGTNSATGLDHTFDSETNGAGHTLSDYVNAIIEVCEKYSVHSIDLFTLVDIDPSLEEQMEYYMPDGLHPNSAGHRYIAEILSHWLEAIALNGSLN